MCCSFDKRLADYEEAAAQMIVEETVVKRVKEMYGQCSVEHKRGSDTFIINTKNGMKMVHVTPLSSSATPVKLLPDSTATSL